MNRFIKAFLFAAMFLFFFLFPQEISAEVVINEINPSGEWVELFKASQGIASLEGCILYFHSLDSSASNTQKKNLTTTDNFLENEFFKVINSGDNWLNNSSSDTVFLDCPDYDSGPFTYGDNMGDRTYARVPNGTGSFVVLAEASMGSANPDVTPSPVLTTTETSTATAEPTSTPAPTPSPTPTKTPTPKPVPVSASPAAGLGETPVTGESMVLGFRNQLAASEAATSSDVPKKGFPILPLVLVLAGALCMGVPGYMFFKKLKSDYTNSDEGGENN